MNDRQALADLEQVTQAKYDQQQQSFARIVGEENRLRGELRRLDGMLHAARTQPEDGADMRAIGADIIWQGWLGRSKTELNQKLAQVLAIKEYHRGQVRQAYGKVMVVQQLRAEASASRHARVAGASLNQAIDQTLFR